MEPVVITAGTGHPQCSFFILFFFYSKIFFFGKKCIPAWFSYWEITHYLDNDERVNGNLWSKHKDFEEWLSIRGKCFFHNRNLLVFWCKYCFSKKKIFLFYIIASGELYFCDRWLSMLVHFTLSQIAQMQQYAHVCHTHACNLKSLAFCGLAQNIITQFIN